MFRRKHQEQAQGREEYHHGVLGKYADAEEKAGQRPRPRRSAKHGAMSAHQGPGPVMGPNRRQIERAANRKKYKMQGRGGENEQGREKPAGVRRKKSDRNGATQRH